MILGIDEAGRGPCVGPMVLCGVIIDENDINSIEALKNLGVKDSKKVTPEKRENINKILRQRKIIKDYFIVKIPAYKIDDALNDPKNSLNILELKSQVKIIKELSKKNKIDKIIIDCPSINTVSYKQQLNELIINKTSKDSIKNTKENNSDNYKMENIFCEHHADSNHIVVSAASIIAKVSRDNEIERLQKKYKKTQYGNLGSGYSSDTLTIEFLKNNYKKLSEDKFLFRKSWQTYKDVENSKKQKKLDEF